MQYYLSAHQRPDLMSGGYLVVRAHDRQTTVGVSRIIQTMAGAAEPVQVHSLDDFVEPQLKPWRTGTEILMVVGSAALVLAAAGVYGVIAYLAAVRHREYAIRRALGADSARIALALLRDTASMIVGGTVAAFLLVGVIKGPLESLLYRTPVWDPTAIVLALGGIFLAGLAATAQPISRTISADLGPSLAAD